MVWTYKQHERQLKINKRMEELRQEEERQLKETRELLDHIRRYNARQRLPLWRKIWQTICKKLT